MKALEEQGSEERGLILGNGGGGASTPLLVISKNTIEQVQASGY